MDPDLSKTVDRLVDRFAERLRLDQAPRIEQFLGKIPDELQAPLLEELLLLELEHRQANGQSVRPSEYTHRFPLQAERITRVFTLAQGLAVELSAAPGGGPPRGNFSSRETPPTPPLSLRDFARRLLELELVPREVLREQLAGSPGSPRVLARALIAADHLTRFQAEMVLRGAGDRLQIGNYRLEEPLGAGGMGQVFRGRHRRLQQPVALKVLSPELCWNKTAIRRFEREVRLASQVSHPNLVRALDAEEQQGRWFLVMELVPGQDLSKRIRKDGPLSVAQAVDCIQQVAQGLQSAHSQGILHRDIKPGNLLLSESGQVKVLDLGLAISLSPDASDSSTDRTTTQLTATGVGLGTVDYMSPEQASDARLVDERSDLYSLGCTLYFLLIGQPPYRGSNPVETLIAHKTAPIPSLRTVRPDVPPALDEMFARLVAKSPEQRYRSCADLLTDLRRLQAQGPSQAAAPTQSPRGSSNPPQSSGPASEDSDAVWSGLTIDPTPVRARSARSTARLPAVPRRWLWGALATTAVLALVLVWWLVSRPDPTTLVLEVSPRDAFVELVNDRGTVVTRGAAQKGQVTLQALPGAYQVRLSQDRFEAQEFPVRLTAGKTNRGKFALAESTDPSFEDPEPEDLTLWFHSREFDDWNKQLRDLPVAQQYQQIGQKLQELNPGMLDELQVHGHPPHVRFMLGIEKVRDLSPLRALKDNPYLKHVEDIFCHKSPDTPGLLADLSPLRGLKLKHLRVIYSPLRDLSPLREMPLESLDILGTQVEKLDPLASCQYLKKLSLNRVRVLSLEPLQDLRLEELYLDESSVYDLVPLKKMTSLRVLTMFNCRQIRSLLPLSDIPLVHLIIDRSGVESLDDLKVDQLESLQAILAPISSVQRLKDARKLVSLDIRETAVRDLSPLFELPVLQSLKLSYSSSDPQDPLRLQVLQLKHLIPPKD